MSDWSDILRKRLLEQAPDQSRAIGDGFGPPPPGTNTADWLEYQNSLQPPAVSTPMWMITPNASFVPEKLPIYMTRWDLMRVAKLYSDDHPLGKEASERLREWEEHDRNKKK
jgi:hypothetical protein